MKVTRLVPRERSLEAAAPDVRPAREAMVCLVGEQPVPNLLPIRHYRLARLALVRSILTRRVASNLESLLKDDCEVHSLEVEPYELIAARAALGSFLEEGAGRGRG